MTAPAYTEQALRDRLLSMSTDNTFDGIVQHLALAALLPDAEAEGFAVTPFDLSDDAITASIWAAVTDRHLRLQGEHR